MLRSWDEQAPFGEKHAPFLGKACSVFGMSRLRLVKKQAQKMRFQLTDPHRSGWLRGTALAAI